MPAKRKIESGQRFGRLVVLRELPPRRTNSGSSARLFLMKCDCGTEKPVALDSIRERPNSSRRTQSCGCLRLERATQRVTTHGMSKLPIYRSWLNMLHRSSSKYVRSGYANVGRDRRWDSFENFHADMAATFFPGAHLARYGDQGDYGPTNCRWLTAEENARERADKRWRAS